MVLFLHAVFNVQAVHVPGIKSDDETVHHWRALGTHPETEGPAEKREVQIPGKVAHSKRDREPDEQQYGNGDTVFAPVTPLALSAFHPVPWGL